MNEVLRFIDLFWSRDNKYLFTQKCCYWFSVILSQRFENATIMYNPSEVHFATMIDDILYDITGVLDNSEDYVDWEEYRGTYTDSDFIEETCIKII